MKSFHLHGRMRTSGAGLCLCLTICHSHRQSCTMGLLPAPPALPADPHVPPSITTLIPQIITSADRLFFVAHKIGLSLSCEWRLVRVAFTESISLYPSALQDGRFLVEFYVPHPQDVRHNAINQQFWLQYCKANSISNGHLDAHLITPSDTSEDRALRFHLHPICCWTNLTHGDTYIHGPFNFATVRGRKTCNRVDQDCWDALATKSSMFSNKLSSLSFPRIPSTWTMAFTQYSLGWRPLLLTIHSPLMHCPDQDMDIHLDKRSHVSPPPFFF